MPFDGNGVYSPIDPPDFPAESGSLIRAAQYNNQINDLAAALSNCLTRDGQGRPTSDINWNGQKITNMAPGTNPGDAIRRDQVVPIMEDRIATNGITINNNVSIKGKRTNGVIINLIFVGADDCIYFQTQTGDWYMRYNPGLDRVEFNRTLRVAGDVNATNVIRAGNNIGAFIGGI